MEYTTSAAITGSPESAIKTVRDALLANGFIIEKAEPTGFTATGPGMTSSKQNAIQGISKATFRAERGLIQVQAELGGVAWLRRFVLFFPLGLGLVMWTFWFLGRAPGNLMDKPAALLVPLYPVLPWLVLGPLMARWIRTRTEKAIQGLLQSAASISELG